MGYEYSGIEVAALKRRIVELERFLHAGNEEQDRLQAQLQRMTDAASAEAFHRAEAEQKLVAAQEGWAGTLERNQELRAEVERLRAQRESDVLQQKMDGEYIERLRGELANVLDHIAYEQGEEPFTSAAHLTPEGMHDVSPSGERRCCGDG